MFFKFKSKPCQSISKPAPVPVVKNKEISERVAVRKGELGEYKIDIQLSQFPKNNKTISDLFLKNPKSSTGYSQLDHVIITPFGIFVIETKNYQGTIYGGKDKRTWSVNGKFKMQSPLLQNYGHIKALQAMVEDQYHSYFISMISFTKRSTFKIDQELRKISSNELVVYDIELTEFIQRKVAMQKLTGVRELNQNEITQIYEFLLQANITDQSIRKDHVNTLKNNESHSNNEVSHCVICNKPVSENVKSFCLSNKKFEGKIYCFDHQRK